MKEKKRFAFALACVLLTDGVPTVALAEPNDLGNTIIQGIVGLFSRASAISSAKKAWLQIDAGTQECVAKKSGAQPNDLMNNGIGPDDVRITPYIEACRDEAEQATAREAQAATDRTTQGGGAHKTRRRVRPAAAATTPAQEANRRDPAASSIPVAARAVQSGQVRMGMTRDQVSAARGAPARKETVPPDYELWHYAAGDIAFTNGHVSYIGH